MKRLIFVIAAITLLASCAKEPTFTDKVKQKIETKLLEVLDDPKSYEFIEIELLDSVMLQFNIDYRKKFFDERIAYEQERLVSMKDFIKSSPWMYPPEKIKEQEQAIQRNISIRNGIDSIEVSLGDKVKDVAAYTYLFTFRAKNAFGALERVVSYIQITPALEIVKSTENKKELLDTPNHFPGYLELLDKH